MSKEHDLILYFGGKFVETEKGLEYVAGDCIISTKWDVDVLCLFDIQKLHGRRNVSNYDAFTYWYSKPGYSLREGRMRMDGIYCDNVLREVIADYKHLKSSIPIRIYVEEFKSRPLAAVDAAGNPLTLDQEAIVQQLTQGLVSDDFEESNEMPVKSPTGPEIGQVGAECGSDTQGDVGGVNKDGSGGNRAGFGADTEHEADETENEDEEWSDAEENNPEEDEEIDDAAEIGPDAPDFLFEDVEDENDEDILQSNLNRTESTFAKYSRVIGRGKVDAAENRRKKNNSKGKGPVTDKEESWYSDASVEEGIESLSDNSSGDQATRPNKFPRYRVGMNMKSWEPKVGDCFVDFKEYREQLRDYLVRSGYQVEWVNNDSRRITVKCNHNATATGVEREHGACKGKEQGPSVSAVLEAIRNTKRSWMS